MFGQGVRYHPELLYVPVPQVQFRNFSSPIPANTQGFILVKQPSNRSRFVQIQN